MKTSHAFLLAILLCVLAASAYGQDVSHKYQVQVNLKEGDPIKGVFLGATADSIKIQQGVVEATIKIDSIARIEFANDTPTKNNALSEAGERAFQALKSLSRLAGAIEVGITYTQYGTLLVQAKTEVDEALIYVPEGEIKHSIVLALDDYAIAGRVWSESLQYRDGIPAKSSTAFYLNGRYNLGITKFKSGEYIKRSAILDVIWGSAGRHSAKAAQLLKLSIDKKSQ